MRTRDVKKRLREMQERAEEEAQWCPALSKGGRQGHMWIQMRRCSYCGKHINDKPLTLYGEALLVIERLERRRVSA